MARTHSGHRPLKLLGAALAACFAHGAAALPTGAAVVNGSAVFGQNGSTLTVTNSDRAIINWGSFSIRPGETVVFDQAASSSVLNRVVTANTPSELLGVLRSPGSVWLINPSGVFIGAGAIIDVGRFVASALPVSDSDFLANRLRFTQPTRAGDIENHGEITTAEGGSVYLIAPNVANHGIIRTPGGELILAAGQTVELLDTGTPGVRVALTAGGDAVNLGQLVAESGRIGMVGAIVRQQGTASASSLVREGGRIFLKATQTAELATGSVTEASGSRGGTIEVDSGDLTLAAGSVSASGSAGEGGRVALLGDKVGVLDGARVDASGATGGGTILVGGDAHGDNQEVSNARISYLAQDASLRADAGIAGDGGKVVVWANDTTRAYGSISARGGSAGGNGGFVEVSGKRSLAFNAAVDTSAARGAAGTLLLDPYSVTITGGGGTAIGGSSWTESSTATTLNWGSIDSQLASTNVTITTTNSGGTGDDILFDTAYSYTASAGATKNLILNANDNISFANLDLKGGLTATAGGSISASYYSVKTAGDMSLTAGTAISANGSGGTIDAGFFMQKAGGTQTINASGAITLTGGYDPGTNGAYLKSSGSQNVTGASITLNAGTNTSANRASIAATGSQTITTTATGNLALNGSADAEALIEAPTQNISVGGNLTLTSGAGAAGRAAIGSTSGAANVQVSASTINVDGTSSAAAAIGALDGSSNASIALTATGSGGIALGAYSKLQAGTSTVSFTANSAGGASLTQAATGEITAQTVSAVGNRSIGLTGLGNNVTNFSGSSSLSTVSFTGNAGTTHVTSASGVAGVTLATTTGGNKVLALGAISTTNTAVSVTASGAILDDNGSGVANVSAGTGNITLTSQNGTLNAGELAISADVATSGTVTATTSGGAYGSIVIRDAGATAVSSAGISASAASSQGNVEYYRYGDLALGGGTAVTLTPKAGATTGIGASGNITISSAQTLSGTSARLAAGGNLTLAGGSLTTTGSGSVTAGGNISLTGGGIALGGADNAVTAGGTLAISGGNALQSASGNLKFKANEVNVSQGSINAGLGIDGVAVNGMTLGAMAAGTGSISAGNGIAKLEIGGAGIALYNGSYINSTDATQSAGGLVKLFFPALSSGGSLIDGVPTFTGGYKVGGSLTTPGQGLEINYGLLGNPVSNAIIAAGNTASDSTGGTSTAGGSLALMGASGSSAPAAGVDGTQTIGGGAGSFGGEEAPAGADSNGKPASDGQQEDRNAKKKPAQCSA